MKKMHARISALAVVAVCTLLTSIARVLWKFGSDRLPEVVTNWPMLGGFALYGIAAVAFLYLLKKGQVSILFPIFASSYIWVTLLSAYFFGEPLTSLKWAGIVVIFAGAIVLGTSKHKHPEAVA
jgi:drug/metabolite transporter (DMT)-like permease